MTPSAIGLAAHYVRIVPGEIGFGVHRWQAQRHGAVVWTPTLYRAVVLQTTSLMAWDDQGSDSGTFEVPFTVPARSSTSNGAGLVNHCKGLARKHKLRWLAPTPVPRETAWIWAARRERKGDGPRGAVLCGVAFHDSGDLVFVQREPKLYIRGALAEVIQCVPSEHFASAVDALTHELDEAGAWRLQLSGVAAP